MLVVRFKQYSNFFIATGRLTGCFLCIDYTEMRETFRNYELTFVRETPTTKLSPREVEVIELAAEGLTYKEIARKLGTSVPTVHHQINNINIKLEARNLRHAVAIWERRKRQR